MNSTIKISLASGASTERAPMSPLRKSALTAGVLYLLTFVSIPTLSIYGAMREVNSVVSPGLNTSVNIGAILEIIVALSSIATAVVLYPILKKESEGLALGLVCSRVLEAGTIFAGVSFILTSVTLNQSTAGAQAPFTSQTMIIMYDRVFLIGQSLMPAVNDLLLGFLLYQSRLVPRSLSLIGILGGPLLVVGDILVLFGLIGQHAPATPLFAVPVALFEFSFGIYLIVKGFKPSSITA